MTECKECNISKPEDMFFSNKEDKIIIHMCKNCFYTQHDSARPQTFMWMFEEYDIPFIAEEWQRTYECDIKHTFGKYLSRMKLAAYRNFGFKDSKDFNAKKINMPTTGLKTIIYCATLERGEKRFDELVENIKDNSHFKIYKSKTGSRLVHLPSGDIWQVVKVNDGARGHRWYSCEVDENISLKDYYQIILPKGIRYKENDIERRVSLF